MLRADLEEAVGEPLPPLPDEIRIFTELPAETSFADTKAARLEMGLALSRRREADEAAAA